jgi:hypothetical protein
LQGQRPCGHEHALIVSESVIKTLSDSLIA